MSCSLAKPDRAQQEEERRAFYVGMTRARKTLAVFDRLDFRPSLPESLAGPAVLGREFTGTTAVSEASGVDYAVLGLDDIHLGYPGQFKEGHPIHTALATLGPGDRLDIRQQDDRAPGLFDQNGTCVARLAQKAAALWAARREAIREVRAFGWPFGGMRFVASHFAAFSHCSVTTNRNSGRDCQSPSSSSAGEMVIDHVAVAEEHIFGTPPPPGDCAV